ncbi:MAG: hypothetical protein M1828_001481 [Chrysothrix sp. TS-e1954]|nr:MAG: hypothetical protein M1828_001481 [Chrysothrix sp. TS-e1954]
MSQTVGMGECCLSGTLASGKPTGRVDQIGGRDTYVAEPSNGSKTKTVVFLADIFGWELPNIRLLADQYAKAGFFAYVPDVHNGDSLPYDFLNAAEPPLHVREKLSLIGKGINTAKVATTLGPWIVRHREGVTKPIIDGFINTIKMTPGTDKVGVIGFCWGARYAILQGHDQVDAVFACHPTLVAIPGDFNSVTKPLSLACGSADSLLSVKDVEKIKDVMAKKIDVPSETRIYEDQVHGFALRGDWSSDKDKKAMDEAEKQGIAWFNKYLS